jgi:aminopeptidase N
VLFINTVRSIVDDDGRWWPLLHDFYQNFKYQNIMTEDVEQFFNEKTGMNLTPVFEQYLHHTSIPTLELKFNAAGGSVEYRWQADEPGFAMPIRVGTKDHWQVIHPTTEWATLNTALKKDDLEVPTDLYYVNVRKE